MTEKMIPLSVIDTHIIELLKQRDKNEFPDQTWNQTQMLNTMVHELEEIKKESEEMIPFSMVEAFKKWLKEHEQMNIDDDYGAGIDAARKKLEELTNDNTSAE